MLRLVRGGFAVFRMVLAGGSGEEKMFLDGVRG